MDKKILFKKFEIIRYSLWFLFIVGGFAFLITKKMPYIIIPATLYALGILMLFMALFFKKSLGPFGVGVGRKQHAYLYWGIIQFWFFTFFATFIIFLANNINTTILLTVGMVILVLMLVLVYLFVRSKK